jgi:hypothetical protein
VIVAQQLQDNRPFEPLAINGWWLFRSCVHEANPFVPGSVI